MLILEFFISFCIMINSDIVQCLNGMPVGVAELMMVLWMTILGCLWIFVRLVSVDICSAQGIAGMGRC